MPEYWGRPTQVMLEPFINARAFYVGALPLLLALIAALRPTRERIALAATAVSLPGGRGRASRRSSRSPTISPASRTAINTRLGIVACLALALLAAFGLDDVLAGRARRPTPAARRRGRAAGADRARPRPGPALAARRRRRHRRRASSTRRARRTSRACCRCPPRWTGWCSRASASRWCCGARLPALIVATRRAGPVRFGHGPEPVDPARPRQAADHRGDQVPAGAPAGALRRASCPTSGSRRSRPTWRCATALQDARGYDYPIVDRYDELWKRAVAPKLPFIPPTTLASTTPAVADGRSGCSASAASSDSRATSACRCRSPTTARTRGSTTTRARCRGPGSCRRRAPLSDQLAAVTAPSFDPRRKAVLAGGSPVTGTGGTATITRYEDERVTLRTQRLRDGGPVGHVVSGLACDGRRQGREGRACRTTCCAACGCRPRARTRSR